MKAKKHFLVMGAAICLSACVSVSTELKYANSDAACIEGGAANFLKYFSDDDAHVILTQVDGLPTGGKGVCVRPGMHKVEFNAVHFNDSRMKSFEFNFEAGKKYRVDASLSHESVDYSVIDLATGEKKLSAHGQGSANQ